MEVPFEKLSPEALRGVIEEFVTREGTDYGPGEYSFEQKVNAVEHQIRRKEVRIVFNPQDETIHLLRADEWEALRAD